MRAICVHNDDTYPPRVTVKQQYREYLRCASHLGRHTQAYKEVLVQVRSAYDKYRHLQDSKDIKLRLSEGNHRLKELDTYVRVAAAKSQDFHSHEAKQDYDVLNNPSYVDPDDESQGAKTDVKGRLGMGWPWE